MTTLRLKTETLTRDAFAAFGDLIDLDGARHFSINDGAIERFHDLATVDAGSDRQGRTVISIGRCNRAATLPYRVTLVERHPLGSQAFYPLSPSPLVIVVAPPVEDVAPAALRAFISNGHQGVNYHRGTWHMPLICLQQDQQFIIVDRAGPGQNCDEHRFAAAITVE